MLQELKLNDSNKNYFFKEGYFDARFLTYTYFKYLKNKTYFSSFIHKDCGLILEIGCGSGIFINNVTQEIVGMDVNFPTLRNIKRDKPRQMLVQADARHLPFKNNSFDFIMSFSVLEHIREPQLVLDEIYRVSMKKGLVTAQVDDRIPIIYDPINAFMKGLFDKKIDGYGMYGLGHCSVLNTRQWLQLLSNSGFGQIKVLSTNRKTSFFQCLEYNLFNLFLFKKRYEDIPIRVISSKIINFFYILYNLLEKIDLPVFKTDIIIKCFVFEK